MLSSLTIRNFRSILDMTVSFAFAENKDVADLSLNAQSNL